MANSDVGEQRRPTQGDWETSGDSLMAAIEGEVIPRLLLAHSQMVREDQLMDGFLRQAAGPLGQAGPLSEAASPLSDNDDEPMLGAAMAERSRQDAYSDQPAGARSPCSASLSTLTSSDVAEFVRLLIHHEPDVAIRFIELHRSHGATLPDLLLDLCAPAARELGEMWLRDDCSFCDVTVGLSSLEHVLTRCAGALQHCSGGTDPARTVLLGAVPGTQHVFGLLIVKELFRRAGWSVRVPSGASAQAMCEAVRLHDVAIVGLSVGRVEDLPACQSLVEKLRRESRNRRLLVVVGGHGIQEANQATRLLDVDLIARDGREGLDQIQRMVNRLHPAQLTN